MDRDQAKEVVKGYLEEYLRQKGINTRRPFSCLNPSHTDKHPSMAYDNKNKRCVCFSGGCGVKYDIFDLIGMDYGLTDNKDIFNKAYELFNIEIDGPGNNDKRIEQGYKSHTEAKKTHTEAKKQEENTNFLNYYKQIRANRSQQAAQDYLKYRGISEDVAAKYWLGYDPNFKTFQINDNGETTYTTWKAIIIPTGQQSYIARNIDTAADKKNRYRKKGPSLIFNSKALYNSNSPVFVVEGEMDALSIIEAGGEAIGLGSTSNYMQLVNLVKNQKPTQPLILALDNDNDGQETQSKLETELLTLSADFYKYELYTDVKDANEALLADKEKFIEEIQTAANIKEIELEAAKDAAKEEYLKTSAADHLADFLDGIKSSANTPAISTGFKGLDTALEGGLYEGLYIIGAISSLGKTTLALQIADNLAESGEDVLIFSLEMARNELISKSISRNTYILADDKRQAKTTRGITTSSRYKSYSAVEKTLISLAINNYKNYASNIYIHEGIGDIGIDQIKETIAKHIEVTNKKPIVIIDYLQILAPSDIRASDKQNTDKAVLELKRLSRDYKIPIIGISSFNRASYSTGSTGAVSMSDFKESGAIEYSSDVLIGLEFASAGSSNYSERDEKKKDPRQIRLVILKNRNGRAWETTSFNYYPLFNYFEEIEPQFEPVTEAEQDIFKAIRGK